MIDSKFLESETRIAIDEKLETARLVIQDNGRPNLYEILGVAVREMNTDTGSAGCMLFIDGKACYIFEAKRGGTDLVVWLTISALFSPSCGIHQA